MPVLIITTRLSNKKSLSNLSWFILRGIARGSQSGVLVTTPSV